ncbi:MAG: CoA transferase [Candidatus Rokubacteria bacterium]|nr:CoA transferase [Candidatus Rokubacteria bacterium]
MAPARPLLEGFRVLDFSRVWAGPYCTMMLAELGADVLKIEHPEGGDETRRYPPFFTETESAYFASFNRGKRSIALDLKRPEGRAVAHRLAARVDVVVENFTAGVTARLGIDYGTLAAINPRIVYCSISAFGQTGPYRERKGYDPILQAMAGIMSLTGEAGRPPVRVGIAIADLSGALFAAFSIVTALLAREQGGSGQHIDLALLDSQVALLAVKAAEYLHHGTLPQRWGAGDPHRVPSGAYETRDGRYLVVIAGEQHWPAFCRALGRPDLIDDPRSRTVRDRLAHREELEAIFVPIFRGRTAPEWQAILDEQDVPAGPVQDLHQVFTHPQVVAREVVKTYEHPRMGRVRAIDLPYRFSGAPPRVLLPPPALGQHTRAILADVAGLSAREIDELISSRAVRTNDGP